MNTTPVTLDMTTAQPIGTQPVQLDMSTAQPIGQDQANPPAEAPSFLGSLGGELKGMGSEAAGMAKGMATTVFPGQGEAVSNIKAIPAIYHAYETARSQGKGVMDAVKAADDVARQQDGARNLIKQRAKEFADNPSEATGKTIMDLIPLALGFVKGVAPESVGAATTKAVKAVKSAAVLPDTPAPIPAPKLPAAVADVKTVQPVLQGNLKSVLADTADEIGIQKPTGASFRDAAKEVGDAVYSRSKTVFSKIDDATNGEFTNVDNKLRNLNNEMRLKAGVNDAADQLMGQQKQVLEGKMNDLMESAKAKGVDPKLVDNARADYKRSQALYDLDAQIKKTTLATSNPANQATHIKSLYTRLNNLADSGRLEEAVGPDKAKAMLGHAEDAANAVEKLKADAATTAEQTKKLLSEHEAATKKQQAAFEKDTQRVKSNRKWAAAATIGAGTTELVHRLAGK